MLVAAAVCPHPPLLIPEATGLAATAGPVIAGPVIAGPVIAGPAETGCGSGGDHVPAAGARLPVGAGWAGEAEADAAILALRAACGRVVAGLAAANPDLIAVVGGAASTASYDWPAAGCLHGLGIPVTVGPGEPVLPLSLTVGSWLLRRFLPPGPHYPQQQDPRPAGPQLPEPHPPGPRQPGPRQPGPRQPGPRQQGPRQQGPQQQVVFQAVRESAATADCLRLGAALAAGAPRVALLVMGDGSARRVLGVHGAADPPADDFDAAAAAALAAADPAGLAGLSPALGGELLATGRAAWQVLAGAALGADQAGAGGSGRVRLRGRLHYAAAPLDVCYLVASWQTER